MMKTLKFALIAALVACTMVSLANADGFKSKPVFKKVVNLDFEKAMTCPGLVAAMYEQIDRNEAMGTPTNIYYAKVVYQGNIYRIKGTREQWIRFFNIKKVNVGKNQS
jgi:hypothetical protein